MGKTIRIDAHQHFWRIEDGYYDWIDPSDSVLYRDYVPEDLVHHLKTHSMDGTITVQASPNIKDTELLLELSEKTNSILGVVGWVDVTGHTFKEDLETLKKHKKFVGIRVMIQDFEDPSILLSSSYMKAFKYLEEQQISVDLLVREIQLPVIVQLLREVPQLRAVIDHLGKPTIAKAQLDTWEDQLQEIASYSTVYCKLSGLVTEAKVEWKIGDFKPYLQRAYDAFGPNRLMFGSDWPVCLVAATYDEVVEIIKSTFEDKLSEEDQHKLFGENAARFYRIDI